MNEIWIISLLVLFGSLIALGGGLLFLQIKSLAKFLNDYASSFAAGVMLTVALLGLIPEAVHELGEPAFLTVLLAFLTTYLFENYLFQLHHHQDKDHHNHQAIAAPIVIIGDTIHNFIDGAAIAAAYLANPALGITTAISTFLHEVPHEIADFSVLLQLGWQKRKVVWTNVLSALTSFLGAFAVILTAKTLDVLGYLLAIAGGLFLYLAASDFLPKPGDHLSHKKAIWVMVAGVVIMMVVLMTLPH